MKEIMANIGIGTDKDGKTILTIGDPYQSSGRPETILEISKDALTCGIPELQFSQSNNPVQSLSDPTLTMLERIATALENIVAYLVRPTPSYAASFCDCAQPDRAPASNYCRACWRVIQ